MNRDERHTEEQLRKLRDHLLQNPPPDDFEQRLRLALATAPELKTGPKRYARKIAFSVASILIFLILLGGYNYNALAYYSKKIVGYEDLVSEHIAALHEAGEGQRIDKTITMDDGTLFIVDALVSDENQIILYYRLSNPNGIPEALKNSFSINAIKGFLTNSYMTHGTSKENDEGTEIIVAQSFEPVSPWAKKLKLSYYQPKSEHTGEYRETAIAYEPNKAMATTLKKRLNKTAKVDEGKLIFKEIIATPTETIIKGKLKAETYTSIFNELGTISLIADGQHLEHVGSGLRRNLNGNTFELRYSPLPDKLDKLVIQVERFTGYVELQQEVDITRLIDGDATEAAMKLKDTEESLYVHNITQSSNRIEVELSTNENMLLKDVRLMTNEGEIELHSTIKERLEKEMDGRIKKYRTLVFELEEGIHPSLQIQKLYVGGMYWNKPYDLEIDIPL